MGCACAATHGVCLSQRPVALHRLRWQPPSAAPSPQAHAVNPLLCALDSRSSVRMSVPLCTSRGLWYVPPSSPPVCCGVTDSPVFSLCNVSLGCCCGTCSHSASQFVTPCVFGEQCSYFWYHPEFLNAVRRSTWSYNRSCTLTALGLRMKSVEAEKCPALPRTPVLSTSG